jgi:DNA (cytosine-5)-methyltransferase 1
MRFVDIFAGLGGFHVAMKRLGHMCVFASEIDETLRDLYEKNFGVRPCGDIREIEPCDVPKHDVLCAGFPCQPFSKAGKQQGRKCRTNGSLFDFVIKILSNRAPQFLILENVPNLTYHDQGRTWAKMRNAIEKLGYDTREARLSPQQFGIPQIRDRVYIVGERGKLKDFDWPKPRIVKETSIKSALEKNPSNAKPLSEQVLECLEVWQEFISRFPKDQHLPTFPIWSMEFGATYPFENETPFAISSKTLTSYKGSHGHVIGTHTQSEQFAALPSYARSEEKLFPSWKIQFIRQNRELYRENKSWIDKWMPKILKFPSSLQKLEWNCKGGQRDIWKYVIQFRASGVRVKRPTSAPSLVAMTTTQVPIIAWEKRFMTPRECARIQGLATLRHLPPSSTGVFKALGNAINVDVARLVAKALIH